MKTPVLSQRKTNKCKASLHERRFKSALFYDLKTAWKTTWFPSVNSNETFFQMFSLLRASLTKFRSVNTSQSFAS